jgi:orotate phosphoribosyltransferase
MLERMFEPLLREHGGWFAGHTRFRSGEHGNGWLEKGALLRSPHLLRPLLDVQARAVRDAFPMAELIVGAPTCGAVVAAFVAETLGLPLALTMPQASGLSFHRMHLPERGLKVVFVDDLIFSGRDARAHLAFFAAWGLEPVGVSAWISRVSSGALGVPLSVLMPAPFVTFEARGCPLCAVGDPVLWQDVRE